MDIKMRDIREALTRDQYHRIANTLEQYGFMKNTAVPVDSEMSYLMDSILRHASVLEYNGKLSENMANVLIRYFAGVNFIYEFAQLVVEAANITEGRKSKKALLNSLGVEKNPYEATQIISSLSENEFRNLMWTISEGDPETIYSVYMFPIVRYVYNHKIIPRHILLAILSMNKCKPVATIADLLKELK